MVEIELGTKQSILLAIECFIEHSTIIMKGLKNKDGLIRNIEMLFSDEKMQEYWISKSFPQKKDSVNSEENEQ